MDSTKRWDKYERFQVLARRWMDENGGKTRKDLAAALEMTPRTLTQYWNGFQIPGRSLMDRMAVVLRADYADLHNGAEAQEPSEVDQFMLRVMGSDLSKLTEKQKHSALEAWRAIVRGYEPPS